jgi:hypothetical protein
MKMTDDRTPAQMGLSIAVNEQPSVALGGAHHFAQNGEGARAAFMIPSDERHLSL